MTTTGTDLVNQLIKLRYQRGITQQHIADIMGVSRPTVARFESNCRRRRTPSLFILQRYATAVGARITLEVQL